MSIDVEKMLDDAVKKMTEAYNSINDYAIEIGVIAADKNRDIHTETLTATKSDGSTVKMTFTLASDITNAELMFIHENGSPLRNLHARPVLQLTIEDALKKLLPDTINRIYDGCFKNSWTKEQVKKELEKMCIRMQNTARNIIYKSNLLAPNAPSTIKAKGSDRPLLDTGQLARSITCRLVLVSSINNSS